MSLVLTVQVLKWSVLCPLSSAALSESRESIFCEVRGDQIVHPKKFNYSQIIEKQCLIIYLTFASTRHKMPLKSLNTRNLFTKVQQLWSDNKSKASGGYAEKWEPILYSRNCKNAIWPQTGRLLIVSVFFDSSQADFLSTGDQDVSCRKISRNNLTFSGAVQEVNPVQFRAQLTKFCYYKFKVRAVVKEKQATTQRNVQ
uniref:Secreted protein n=1 Tax=Rhodnius prolixus TaxID=13249 RepID=T1HF64_RHOPR